MRKFLDIVCVSTGGHSFETVCRTEDEDGYEVIQQCDRCSKLVAERFK